MKYPLPASYQAGAPSLVTTPMKPALTLSGNPTEFGLLKVFLSTEYLELDWIEQESPFAHDSSRKPSREIFWGSAEFSIYGAEKARIEAWKEGRKFKNSSTRAICTGRIPPGTRVLQFIKPAWSLSHADEPIDATTGFSHLDSSEEW
ncbi:hypothetical protein C8R44DRAFT_751796 [Mycena epipterygia]|nr:hypothetical protein C8R44DRAFT_751796 [Mycena epipterygia]